MKTRIDISDDFEYKDDGDHLVMVLVVIAIAMVLGLSAVLLFAYAISKYLHP